MSLYFVINNFVFAFGMVGAIVYLMASWLSLDSYKLKPDSAVMLRVIGLAFCAFWEIVNAISLGSDLLSYLGFILFGIGLLCILSSFLKKTELVMHAVVVIPAFSIWSDNLHAIAGILSLGIGYMAFRQWRIEQNGTWKPFSLSFLILGISSIFGVFAQAGGATGVMSIAELVTSLIAFNILGYWIWQYMRLRIRESIVMLSIGATFLLATVVTLAFSTILIGRVTSETARNLITDVKVLDFAVTSLQGESLAKAKFIAKDADMVDAISKNDFATIEQLAEKFLQDNELGFLTIADSVGNVIVRADALSKRGDSLVGYRAFEEASHGNSYVTVADSVVEGLSIRAGAPILDSKGKFIGAIIAGYPLDNAFVDKMKKVTGLEMFMYKDNTSVSGTAFAADGVTRLTGITVEDSEVNERVLNAGKTITSNVSLHGELFQVSYSPLINADGKVVGMLSAAKPQQDITNIANATNRLTLITVILILLVLLLPIYFFSKRFGESDGL